MDVFLVLLDMGVAGLEEISIGFIERLEPHTFDLSDELVQQFGSLEILGDVLSLYDSVFLKVWGDLLDCSHQDFVEEEHVVDAIWVGQHP